MVRLRPPTDFWVGRISQLSGLGFLVGTYLVAYTEVDLVCRFLVVGSGAVRDDSGLPDRAEPNHSTS